MTAHVIADDAEAVAVAMSPADEFRRAAATRDAERRFPRREMTRFAPPVCSP